MSMINIPTFKQGDPRWGNLKLVDGKHWTLASDGCFITSLSAALNPFFGFTPDTFYAKLRETDGINTEGMVNWYGVERATEKKAVFIERQYTDLDPRQNGMEMEVRVAINRVRRYMDLGSPVVLTVDLLKNDGIADHAVLAYDYILDGDEVVDFWIMDPAFGEKCLMTKRYGKPDDKLYGYVGLSLPPMTFPDSSKLQKFGGAFWKAGMVSIGKDVETYSGEIVQNFLSV